MQVVVTVLPLIIILVPAFIFAIATTGGHVDDERTRISDSMVARALGDQELVKRLNDDPSLISGGRQWRRSDDEVLAEKLNNDRVKRIKRRFDAVEGGAFTFSPYGLIARLISVFTRITR